MKKMHSGKFNFKKLYLVLALVFIIGCLPSGSYALENEEPEQEAVVTVADPVGEEETVEPETPEQEPEESSITYDLQPTSLAEVQAAIDAYETEYQAVLAADGYLKAIEVPKPHWQYEVAAALMPAGYHCELVDWDEGFGADYYTFFVGAAVMTTTPWGTNGIIVETEDEFRSALSNTTYTTIYLGANITMLSSTVASVPARTGTTLVINGTDPRDGTRHTYTDYASAANGASLQGTCVNITFKDMNVYINTYFGIYYPTAAGGTVTLDGVTGQAAQFYFGFNSTSTIVIKDSVLTLRKTHTYTQELVQNAGKVRFEGTVSVTREPGVYPNAYWDELFYLTGAGSVVEVADNANVTIDNNVTTGDYGGGAIFYTVGSFVVGDNASFTCYSTTGFAEPDATAGALGSVTIGAGADVRFICTTSHYWYNSGLRGTNFTTGAGSKFLIYNVDTTAGYGAFHFTNVTLNNPESFVVLNPSARAIGSTASKLEATGVSSIRYYASSAISGLFDTSSYAYMPTANYSRLWVQSAPFNVTATTWSTAPGITTNYSNRSATAAETSITSGNFIASNTVYGIEIRGSSYPVSGTVSGLPDNSNLTITYTIDNGSSQTVTTDSSGYYTIPGVPYGAKVVITPPSAPQHYTLSPTSITLDSVTAASTGNDFTYTQITFTVTEKFVDESTGTSIPGVSDNSVTVLSSSPIYSYAGSTADITSGTDVFVYQGYKVGNYSAGDTLDGTGWPTSISVVDGTTVHLVYSLKPVNVTVSKTVTGDYADTTKAFTFTVYFEDDAGAPLASGTEFSYTGGVISGSGATAPANDKLTLDSEGKATFTLRHGQTITIAGVAANGEVRVVETADANYTASFEDSIVPGSTSGNDTTMRDMTSTDRTFDFTNVRDAVVPSGIAADSGGMFLLVLLAISTLAAGLAITIVNCRRRVRTR